MAEWSKALRSGRSIFGCVGSNPTPVKFLNILDYISSDTSALRCSFFIVPLRRGVLIN